MAGTKENALAPIDAKVETTLPATSELVQQGYNIELVHTLEEGETIRGVFMGPGSDIEFFDKKTGEVRPLKTWKISQPGLSVTLIGASQMNARLGSVEIGSEVIISRTGQAETRSGYRVNTYLIAAKPPTKQARAQAQQATA